MKLAISSAAFDNFLDKKYSRINFKIKLGILIAACAVPLVIFFFVIVAPKNNEIKGLEEKRDVLQKEITSLELAVKDLENMKAEMKETELNFEAASRLLPQQKEIPSLLTSISAQGTNSGLDVITFQPNAEQPEEFYAKIPVNIAVRGPYHNVGMFLDKISKLPRIVSVSNIVLSSPQAVEGEMMLNANFNLVTYRFIEPSDEKQQQQQKK